MLKKETKIKIAAVAAALIIIAALVIVYYTVIRPKAQDGLKTVTLEIAYSDNLYRYENLETEKNYYIDFLTEYNKELELGLKYDGTKATAYITSLKGTANNGSNNFYYAFLVNGAEPSLGISDVPVKNGDVIRFEYRAYDSLSWQPAGLAPENK